MARDLSSIALDPVYTLQGTAASEVPPVLRLSPAQSVKLTSNLFLIRQGPPVAIPRTERPLWYEKGWREAPNANGFVGQYAVAGHTWRGLIEQPYSGGFTAYIWHPPLDEIRRNTTHAYCFTRNGEADRYLVHYCRMPLSLDHAIVSVERVLAVACKRAIL
jgi:hypothetical protein